MSAKKPLGSEWRDVKTLIYKPTTGRHGALLHGLHIHHTQCDH